MNSQISEKLLRDFKQLRTNWYQSHWCNRWHKELLNKHGKEFKRKHFRCWHQLSHREAQHLWAHLTSLTGMAVMLTLTKSLSGFTCVCVCHSSLTVTTRNHPINLWIPEEASILSLVFLPLLVSLPWERPQQRPRLQTSRPPADLHASAHLNQHALCCVTPTARSGRDDVCAGTETRGAHAGQR